MPSGQYSPGPLRRAVFPTITRRGLAALVANIDPAALAHDACCRPEGYTLDVSGIDPTGKSVPSTPCTTKAPSRVLTSASCCIVLCAHAVCACSVCVPVLCGRRVPSQHPGCIFGLRTVDWIACALIPPFVPSVSCPSWPTLSLDMRMYPPTRAYMMCIMWCRSCAGSTRLGLKHVHVWPDVHVFEKIEPAGTHCMVRTDEACGVCVVCRVSCADTETDPNSLSSRLLKMEKVGRRLPASPRWCASSNCCCPTLGVRCTILHAGTMGCGVVQCHLI